MASTNKATVETAPQEVIITRTINAPRELVFDAFTKAGHLEKWYGPYGFTVTAESEPRVGGKYEITMHGTAALPGHAQIENAPMIGAFLEFVRPEKIVYTCNLEGHPESWKSNLKSKIESGDNSNFLSAVATITFDDIDGKTKVVIRSRFESDAVRNGYVKLGMNEGWSQSLDKLEDYLGGIVIVERVYNAPVERVWNAITNNDELKQWYFKLDEFRPEVGFEFEFEGTKPSKGLVTHLCKIIEVVPKRKLSHSWRFKEHDGDSVVTFELFPEGDKTRLRLTHTGLETFGGNINPDFAAHNFAAGWGSILGTSLKNFVEK